MSKKWTFSVALTPEMAMAVAQYCQTHRVSRSEALRQLIQRGIDSIK